MLGSRVAPATPVPSSDHDVPSSPSSYAKHGGKLSQPSVATPPPSSPTRDHPFSLFAEALEHAASRQHPECPAPRGVSPVKRDAPPPSSRCVVRALTEPDVGIRTLPDGNVLLANYTHTLVLGRAKALDRTALSEVSPAFMGSQPAVSVCLPGTAKHVSRVHALVRWVPFTSPATASPHTTAGTFVLRIVGQNGLIVDGKRLRPDQVVRLEPGRTRLDFFGVPLRFVAPAPAPVGHKRVAAPVSGVSPTKQPCVPLPPSSPEPRALSGDEASEPESPTRAPTLRAMPGQLPGSSPAAAEAERVSDVPGRSTPSGVRGASMRHRSLSDRGEALRRSMERDAPSTPNPRAPVPSDSEASAPSAPSEPAPPVSAQCALPEPSPSASAQLAPPAPAQPALSASAQSESAPPEPAPPTPAAPAASAASAASVAPTGSHDAVPVPPNRTPSWPGTPASPAPVSSSATKLRSTDTEKRSKSEKRTDTPRAEPSQVELVRSLVGRLAPTYDLAGLLAGAIVFHRTATISSSEAVRSVLSSNPGMLRGEAGARAAAFSPSKRRLPSAADEQPSLAHGTVIAGWESGSRWQTLARRAWHECLEMELQRAPMFGVIQRPGKDTSGKPLECWYHYDKENDPDVERAQNLGAFVKPMRNVVRSQKPIFWKKSEYSRATSGASTDAQDDLLPYSPRAHYSDDTDDPERRKRASTPSAKRAKLA